MNSITTRKSASSRKDDSARSGFRGKETMPPDSISVKDIQMALHDECDFAAQPICYQGTKQVAYDHDYNYPIF